MPSVGKVQLACRNCSAEIFTYISSSGSPCRVYCCRQCYLAHKKYIPDRDEFFWSRVAKTDSCWLWTGAKAPLGYGQLPLRFRPLYTAHRLSWEINIGPIPRGMFVCHNCPGGDNPSCVNPAHLFLGTHAENMKDMAQKGRAKSGGVYGEGSGRAKLTEQQVLEILGRCGTGESHGRIAQDYGVTRSSITLINTRKNWKHLTPPPSR